MEAQMKKGILEMCVLFTIRDKEMYGYDVMKTLKRHFPEVNESTFYAILRRLHAEKYADISLGVESNGPTRKYYKISEKGRDYLRDCVGDWNKIRDIVASIGIG